MGEMNLVVNRERTLQRNRIGIRTYAKRPDITEHHSFLMGCDTFGLSSLLGIQTVNEKTTLKEFRTIFEINKDRGMNRRSTMFCEILQLMQSVPNPFEYSDKKKYTEYKFGVIPVISPTALDIPFIIPRREESYIRCMQLPVIQSYPTLVIVPITQVNPYTGQVEGWEERNEKNYNNFEFPLKKNEK